MSSIRGEDLDNLVIRMITTWDKDQKLTWTSLAKRARVARQSLERKAKIYDVFWEKKRALDAGRSKKKDSIEESYERQIKVLEERINVLQQGMDMHLEKFAQVEHNCRRLGWDSNKLWIKLPIKNETNE